MMLVSVRKELNKEFRIVFQPKHVSNDLFAEKSKKRFLVGAGQLSKYITENNVKSAVLKALNSLEDKTTIKYRKYGRIDFYRK